MASLSESSLLSPTMRSETEDSLTRYIALVGENSVALHDRAKKKRAKWWQDKLNMYSKTVAPCADLDSHSLPPSIFESEEGFPNPMLSNVSAESVRFPDPDETVLVDIVSLKDHETFSREFLRAGPRRTVYFDPKVVRAAIVTCGGLCPGLNTVIREIYKTLKSLYGVEKVFGIPYGFVGFYNPTFTIRELTDNFVSDIHHEGGTVLGASRGGHDTKKICDAIADFGFNQVYIIGGDGTHRGATKISAELMKRKLKASVVGIPKTIDNDIALIDRSFGFETAVQEAQRVIDSAKTEAISSFNGIGLVKLMGRYSGHIAMSSVLASRDVDACLIPEIKFELGGPHGLLAYLKKCLATRGHAVVVIAEGAGEQLVSKDVKPEMDASGNVRLPDVGLWLRQQILDFFKAEDQEVNLKYLDPTYMIRTVPANASDKLMCSMLGQNAVHGAFAGFTGFTVGLINARYVFIPMDEIAAGRVQVDVISRKWHRVLATTRQPTLYEPDPSEFSEGDDSVGADARESLT